VVPRFGGYRQIRTYPSECKTLADLKEMVYGFILDHQEEQEQRIAAAKAKAKARAEAEARSHPDIFADKHPLGPDATVPNGGDTPGSLTAASTTPANIAANPNKPKAEREIP
jgi:hypothetical protein